MDFIKLFNISLSLVACVIIITGCGSNETSSQNPDGNGNHQNIAASQSNPESNEHTHENGDDHHHEKVPGPNGGRLIVDVEPHIEFLILPNRHAQITFVNDDIKPIPPTDLNIKLIGGDRSNPIEIAFSKKENVLISATPLPEEHNLALVLQIAGKSLKETVFERFHLNMETCPDCDLHEYACICGHSEHAH